MRLLIGRRDWRDDIPRTTAGLRPQLPHEGRAALPFANPTGSTAAQQHTEHIEYAEHRSSVLRY
jgi:hypothetical protein